MPAIPTLTLPIVEHITLNMLLTLAKVTTANGYQFTLDVVRASSLGDVPGVDQIRAALLEQDPTEDETPQLHKTWDQPYSILLMTFDSDPTFPARQKLQIAWASIYKELRKNRQRGKHPITGNDLAINTEIKAPQWFDYAAGQGRVEGMVSLVEVRYRHLIDDPFTQ